MAEYALSCGDSYAAVGVWSMDTSDRVLTKPDHDATDSEQTRIGAPGRMTGCPARFE